MWLASVFSPSISQWSPCRHANPISCRPIWSVHWGSDGALPGTIWRVHSRMRLDLPARNRWGRHLSVDRRVVANDRNPLDRPYPRDPNWSVSHRPSRSPSNCRKRWVYIRQGRHLLCNWWGDRSYRRHHHRRRHTWWPAWWILWCWMGFVAVVVAGCTQIVWVLRLWGCCWSCFQTL